MRRQQICAANEGMLRLLDQFQRFGARILMGWDIDENTFRKNQSEQGPDRIHDDLIANVLRGHRRVEQHDLFVIQMLRSRAVLFEFLLQGGCWHGLGSLRLVLIAGGE